MSLERVPTRWTVSPGEAAPGGPVQLLAHLLTDHVTFCGEHLREDQDVFDRAPGGVRHCPACRRTATARRKAAGQATSAGLDKARRKRVQALIDRYTGSTFLPTSSYAQAAAEDADGRRRERGTSVRPVRGGLPSLGHDR